MDLEVTVDRRFRGPPNSGNGGYVCGVLADGIEGPATATLRVPPPLDTAMSLSGDGKTSELLHGAVLVGKAQRATLNIGIPEAVSLEVATGASERFVGFEHHIFPGCFVCGPDRQSGDGLRIFPGLVGASGVVAAPWIPDPSLNDSSGGLDPRHMWAALDCPSYFGIQHAPKALLGRLTAEIKRIPVVGEPLVALGWSYRSEGRKHFCGSALVTDDGEVVAAGDAIWIEVAELPT